MDISFRPVNRHIIIEMVEAPQPEVDSGILLPEDYAVTEERYGIAKVLGRAADVSFASKLVHGREIIVDRSMVEEVQIKEHKFQIVLENYVLGIIDEELHHYEKARF